MALWTFIKTKLAQTDTMEKYAWKTLRENPLYQNVASAFSSPIVKNLAPMGNINVTQGPNIMVSPATLTSGYGGLVTGQFVLQSLQNQSTGSGGQ